MAKYRCDLDLDIQAKDGGWICVETDTAYTPGDREAIISRMKKSVEGDGMKYRIYERLEVVTESEIYF